MCDPRVFIVSSTVSCSLW